MPFNKSKTYGNCISSQFIDYECDSLAVYKNKKLCEKCYNNERYWSNPEEARARASQYQKDAFDSDPSKVKRMRKNNDLMVNYGITLDQYERQFLLQNGACAICKRPQIDLGKPLAVDHCHKTGEVRGLLCTGCNMALGGFVDDIDNLNTAINYLNKGGVWNF